MIWILSEIVCLSVCLFTYCGAVDQTQCGMYAKQVLHHWAISPAQEKYFKTHLKVDFLAFYGQNNVWYCLSIAIKYIIRTAEKTYFVMMWY